MTDVEQFVNDIIAKGAGQAVFDVDNTIVRTNITELYIYMKLKKMKERMSGFAATDGAGDAKWEDRIRIKLLTRFFPVRRLLWLSGFALLAPYYLLLDYFSREAFQRVFYRRYSEFSRSDIERESRQFFQEVLVHRFIPAARDLLVCLKERGVSVMLLSTNIEPVVREVAKCFDVPYVCLKLNESNGRALVDLGNLSRFKQREIERFNPETTIAIADSKHDLPVLMHARHAVVVAKRRKRWMRKLKNSVILPQ